MSTLWSLAIVAGLLILVYLMIAGVPRDADRLTAAGTAIPRTLLPMLGAMATVCGIVGYLSAQWVGFGVGLRSAIVFGVGLIAALAARWFVRATFAVPSTDPDDDPRYRYQGQVAVITQGITRDHPGRVAFQIDGKQFDLSAQSTDGAPVASGTEVVIERIDDDLATVELWAVVEQRL